MNEPQNQTRSFALERAAGTENTFAAVCATAAEIDRADYFEVLDLSRCDLSRAPLPLLESHNSSALNVGLAENFSVDGDKLRCSIRFGTSARALELAADIRAGIVRSLSVGYELSDPIQTGERDGLPIYSFKFMLHEVSLVSIPADTQSGFFRSSSRKNIMESQTNYQQSETDRIAAIRGMADLHDLQQLGISAIAEGLSLADFNRRALDAVSTRNDNARTDFRDTGVERSTPPHSPNHYAGLPCDNSAFGRSMDNYSLLRVLRGISDPRALGEAGLELEISSDMQRVLGRRSKGILIPYEALQQRAVTKAGSGGNLVATDHLSGSFIDVLRNASVVMGLGPTVLRGLQGDVDIPRKTSGATGYWIAADNSDAITESDVALDSVSLAAKTVGGACTFSHKLIVQSSPDIEGLVRQDLADLIASQIDLKSISGTGASNQPRGILATSGVGSATYANAGAPSFADIVALETAIATANAAGRLSYLTTPAMAGAFKTTPRQGSGVEGNFILQSGMMNDLPAFTTGNMSAGYVLLGDFSQLLVGFWGGIEIDVDPYGANFLKGSVTVRVLADIDFAVRHPGAFAELHEAAA